MNMTDVGRALARLRRRISLVVSRATLSLVDDDALLQAVQVKLLAGETLDGVERFQDYGITSHPHPEAEAVAVSVCGQRDHTIIIRCDDRRYRLNPLAQGEVALYTDEGDHVLLKRGNVVEIKTKTLHVNATTKVQMDTPLLQVNATTKVELNTPLVQTTGQIKAALDITDQTSGLGQSMKDMRGTYNGHKHTENDNRGLTELPNQSMGG